MEEVKIVAASEDSIQIQFEQKICPKVNRQISAFCQTFELFTKDMPQIREIVPTYCSVSIYFDEVNCKAELITQIAEEVLEKMEWGTADSECATKTSGAESAFGGAAKDLSVAKSAFQEPADSSFGAGKIVRIPVCYDDEEFAPDLKIVASHANFSKDEVIKLHSSTDYLIYMMGFLPGFPYLGGMDERLKTPRLQTPRTKIPAGSVAIGGEQTGLYPVESPGGWNIIGRTPLKVFDLNREPKFLYRAGDKIRFVPISRTEFDTFDEEKWLDYELTVSQNKQASTVFSTGSTTTSTEPNVAASSAIRISKTNGVSTATAKPTYKCGGGIKIVDTGLLTSIQDLGTFGYQKYGIGQSGAMDQESLKLANFLCGNEENTACLETTLSGPTIYFATACDFAITGAEFSGATLDGSPLQMNKKISAKAGSTLVCGFATKGLRSYIAFGGGLLVPEVFSSRSTNLKSKTGGYKGRKLQTGDEIAIGYQENARWGENAFHKSANSFTGGDIALSQSGKSFLRGEDAFSKSATILPAADKILSLACVKSSQFDFFDSACIEKFTSSIYTITPESDRMGIRFSGESLECGKTDIISDSIPFGAVQITSAGLPVVMAADRQTTGGYAKIACVKKKSMCELAQAGPGTKVRFYIEEIRTK